MTYSPLKDHAEQSAAEAQAAALPRLADAAETFANAFAKLVDIIGRLPAPGQGMWKK